MPAISETLGDGLTFNHPPLDKSPYDRDVTCSVRLLKGDIELPDTPPPTDLDVEITLARLLPRLYTVGRGTYILPYDFITKQIRNTHFDLTRTSEGGSPLKHKFSFGPPSHWDTVMPISRYGEPVAFRRMNSFPLDPSTATKTALIYSFCTYNSSEQEGYKERKSARFPPLLESGHKIVPLPAGGQVSIDIELLPSVVGLKYVGSIRSQKIPSVVRSFDAVVRPHFKSTRGITPLPEQTCKLSLPDWPFREGEERLCGYRSDEPNLSMYYRLMVPGFQR